MAKPHEIRTGDTIRDIASGELFICEGVSSDGKMLLLASYHDRYALSKDYDLVDACSDAEHRALVLAFVKEREGDYECMSKRGQWNRGLADLYEKAKRRH